MTAPNNGGQKYEPGIVRRAVEQALRATGNVEGAVVEIRAIKVERRYGNPVTIAGFFNDPAEAARWIATPGLVPDLKDNRAVWLNARGIYFTLNEVHPDCLHKIHNRLRVASDDDLTKDKHITRYRWLLVDVDRDGTVKDISASDKEKAAILATIEDVERFLAEMGFPEPLRADSGNGYHRLYPIDIPVDDAGQTLVRDCLLALAHRFDGERAGVRLEIDKKVFNPGRISKVYNTIPRKGDGAAERPHRQARILQPIPAAFSPVPRERLEALAALAPKAETPATGSAKPGTAGGARLGSAKPASSALGLSMSGWLTKYSVGIAKKKDGDGPHVGWTFYVLEGGCFNCQGKDAAFLESPTGAKVYKCFHDGCSGIGWREARVHFGDAGYDADDPSGWDEGCDVDADIVEIKPLRPGYLVRQRGKRMVGKLQAINGNEASVFYERIQQTVIVRLSHLVPKNSNLYVTQAQIDARARFDEVDDTPPTDEERAWAEEAYKSVRRERARRARVVVNDRQLRDSADEALVAIVAANDPAEIFVRGSELTRIRRDEKGQPEAQVMTAPAVRHHLTSVADFYFSTEKTIRSVPPPKDIVEDIMARAEWPLPRLEGIMQGPFLRVDGSVCSTPGYDEATGLYYHKADGAVIPNVSEQPTERERAAARALLDELLCDFPFVAEADKTNAVGLALTAAIRPAVAGAVPCGAITATSQGTGKGLLTDCISIAATGQQFAASGAAKSEEEWTKKITSLLIGGRSFIVLDNVEGEIRSAELARAITAPMWEERVLSMSKMVRLPVRVTWVVNGNNVVFGGDMARRSYVCRLDAKTARPWKRGAEQFTHPDLVEWAKANHGRLLWALLTLARAWFVDGKPLAASPVIGSFEAWSRTIGGILKHAGYSDFLGNLETMYDQSDRESAEWEAFLAAMAYSFDGRSFTVAGLTGSLHGDARESVLRDALPDRVQDDRGSVSKIRLGKAFQAVAGRRYGPFNLRLERLSDDRRGVARWRVDADIASNQLRETLKERYLATADAERGSLELDNSDGNGPKSLSNYPQTSQSAGSAGSAGSISTQTGEGFQGKTLNACGIRAETPPALPALPALARLEEFDL